MNSISHKHRRDPVGFSNLAIGGAVTVSFHDRPIEGLIKRRSPSAIRRLVVSVGVDSLDGKRARIPRLVRPILERLKRQPLVAHLYAFPTVVMKLSVIGIAASVLHVLPCLVKTGLRASMNRESLSRDGGKIVAARLAFPFSKVRSESSGFSSTRASAAPKRSASSGIPVLMENYPLSKRLASHIDQSRVFHTEII